MRITVTGSMECVGPTPASNGMSCITAAEATPNEVSNRMFEGKNLHKRVITAFMNLTWASRAHDRTLVKLYFTARKSASSHKHRDSRPAF